MCIDHPDFKYYRSAGQNTNKMSVLLFSEKNDKPIIPKIKYFNEMLLVVLNAVI